MALLSGVHAQQEAQAQQEPSDLVEAHLWIARQAARRFAGRSEASDDLFQVACVGLVKAAQRFDPGRGVRFATFAMPTVVGEIRRHFRDRTWALRVARGHKDLHLQLRSAAEQLTHRLHRSPTVPELAAELQVSTDRVVEALSAGESYQTLSIDGGPQDTDRSSADLGMVPSVIDGDVDATPQRLLMRDAVKSLPLRDRRAVHLRFYQGQTQAAIAAELGISQVHVSRILRSALDRLQEVLDVPAASHET